MSSPNEPTASDRIVRARGRMSQAELARRAGLTRQTLNQIERGLVIPRVDTALRLAGALGCSLESLFGNPGPPEPQKIPVHVIGPVPENGARVDLAWLDGRWIAHGSDVPGRIGAGLGAADGRFRKGGKGAFAETHAEVADLEENLFVAGCDPALPMLCDAASRPAPRGRCVWIPCGSSSALRRLANGEVHLAGIHFGGKDDGVNMAEVGKVGLANKCTVIRFSRWEQGWMIRGDADFSGAADFAGGRMRLANREKGSACRKHLDRILKEAGIAAEDVAGYGTIALNHADCARLIAGGHADVGLGCGSVATVFGLKFIPLEQVAFDLVIRSDQLGRPLLAGLVNLVSARRFAAAMSEIPGYEVSDTGRVLAG